MKSQDWFVYIVQNEKGYLYTGITTDVERRFAEHRTSKKGAKFFRSSAPIDVLFIKKFPNRSLASKFESMVKKMNRQEKILLVETGKVKT
jgi:putative endonuclease